MGGVSIPYATTPMNSRTGMTIGGTRYFIVVPIQRGLWRQPRITHGARDRHQITTCWRGLRRRGRRRRAIPWPANISSAPHRRAPDPAKAPVFGPAEALPTVG